MKHVLMLLLAFSALSASAQQVPPTKRSPFRIAVRHADPWFVKAMLEGIPVTQPEHSSRPGFQGLGQQTGQAISSLLEGGRLIVNPTDNSLWWYPNP